MNTQPGKAEPFRTAGGRAAGDVQTPVVGGADPQDIDDVVRVMQYQLLFALCYLLSDPGDLEPEVSHISWQLVQIEDGMVTDAIGMLHESVLGMDPTGR